jgi:pilus assembly protein Flp/PilA
MMRIQLNTVFLWLYVKFEIFVSCDEGQDLVEYALVVALIALGAVASMRTVATSISTEFSVIEKTFSNAV